MKGILIYQPADKTAPVPDFIDGLDPRLREKIIIRLYHLSQSHKPIIHSHEVPYRRFVFWISQEYCNHLMQLSPDYVYLMQYVQTGNAPDLLRAACVLQAARGRGHSLSGRRHQRCDPSGKIDPGRQP